MDKIEKEYLYNRLSALGDFYRLSLTFDSEKLLDQLNQANPDWVEYNKSKSWSNRFGLSLFSLDGGSSGEIDLNSVREWNKQNNTSYTELSFNTPTKYWKALDSISSQFSELEGNIGRTHLIRLDEGGIFPPHRDNYRETDFTFRLVSFFNCSSFSLQLCLNNELVHYDSNQLYFLNTRKVHSLVSFEPEAMVLVLNIKICEDTINFVYDHILEN